MNVRVELVIEADSTSAGLMLVLAALENEFPDHKVLEATGLPHYEQEK